ncbi:hypothetical protein [Arthrobacter sp. zg-Y1171]|uniref:hypothetical protein n=1 Tax=Arthrobacter sp. zg-Y1171 TaxID=2964610 RepID=UPI002107802E|nr:hypothetical protein [Arthrobacter sp. zg-Y1171]MCQ1995332.1 hypothetical protein [Arthrobacter sp. zg-Y1171]UWX80630.1 hypothetical protein N2L00_09270 [Arthrobacter sp. zg-Y1171]
MTQTVGGLFPIPDGERVHAWLSLEWGSRKETPVRVAERILLTLPLIRKRFPDPDAQWQMSAQILLVSGQKWIDIPKDPESLGALIQSPRQRDVPYSKVDTGTLKAKFSLTGTGDPENGLFSFEISAGRSGVWGNPANEITLLPPAEFVIGSPEDARRWFGELVHIWQPETACLTTPETMTRCTERGTQLGVGQRSIYAPSVGYLNWFSRTGYGRLPFPLDAATRECPDGTLIAVREWNAAAVADLYAELETMGMLHKIPDVQLLDEPVGGYGTCRSSE